MQHITLTESDKKILKAHAESENPNEACAILFGKGNTITEVFLTRNIDESPTRFTISNEQLIKAYEKAEKTQKGVIGIFHSHPNSEAYPSSTDKKFMESNPVVWIIYSGNTKEFRAYTLESEIAEVQINEEQPISSGRM